jgi:uncharacterized protein YcbK (DUF882 family)
MLVASLLKLSLTCGLFIPINSGLRSVEHNRRVGGVPNSMHLQGKAFDLGLHPFNAKEKRCLIRYSRRIFNKVLIYPNHLHVE